MMGKALSEHIIRLRKDREFELELLAQLASMTPERLQAIEDGVGATIRELDSLSRLLGADLLLYDEDEDERPVEHPPVKVLLKASRNYIEPGTWGVVLEAAETAHAVRMIDSLLEEPSSIERLRSAFAPDTEYTQPLWREGQRLAQALREHLGLGQEPVGSMYQLCRSLGVSVIEAELPRGVAGFCLADERHGVAIIINVVGGQESLLQRRFALAHELCHVLYDRHELQGIQHLDPQDWSGRDKQEVDIRADAFAIHFLAPYPTLESRWRRDEPVVASRRLIEELGVSFAALSYHLQNAGLITDQQRSRLHGRVDTSTPRSFIVAEQHPNPDLWPHLPLRVRGPLFERVKRAFEKGALNRSQVIELLDIDGDEFEVLFRPEDHDASP